MSELGNADSLEDLLPHDDSMSTWLVIEQDAQTLRRLYELEETPDFHYLFHGTRYAECLDKSPLVVRVSPSGSLWQAFVDGQGEPPLRGILAVTESPLEAVMAHLRKLLEVTFYGKRRALLRFYDPWIMAVLMNAGSYSSRWLGPLMGICWHGGTFAQRAQLGAVWHACMQTTEETETANTVVQEPLTLTREEESALETFVDGYPFWAELEAKAGLDAGSAEHAARFITALDEVERFSVPPAQQVDYLIWRFAHYEAGLPPDMAEIAVKDRLPALRRYIDREQDGTDTGKVLA